MTIAKFDKINQRDQDFADIGFEKQLDLVRHYGPLHQVRYPEYRAQCPQTSCSP